MSNRTPSLSDLNKLNRDEWEDLCSSICVLNYSAHRIEDHFGKGNGLDAFRENQKGVEGWQIRKFNNRLLYEQEKRIKENILLAKERCLSELYKPLVKFTIIFNINPEPGHKNKLGEIQRLANIKKWAKDSYNIEFVYKGVSWVHSVLLNNPTLMPQLFEDINRSILDASRSLNNEIFDLKKEIKEIVENNSLSGKLREIFELLVNEAKTHYDRGVDHESHEEFQKSITSMSDALRLIEGKNIDKILEGKILSFLGGTEATIGYLKDATTHSKRAVKLLKDNKDSDFYIYAKGNLAFSLLESQKYKQSKKILRKILLHFENKGNLLEIVRTLTHLLEIEIRIKNFNKARVLADRLLLSASSLDKVLGGISQVSVGAIATVANLYADFGVKNHDRVSLNKAVDTYKIIEEATVHTAKKLYISAKFGRARCTWNLDDLIEAEKVFKEVISESEYFLPKVSIDAKYNLALMFMEKKCYKEAGKYLKEVIGEYGVIGDLSSVNDAKRMLQVVNP